MKAKTTIINGKEKSILAHLERRAQKTVDESREGHGHDTHTNNHAMPQSVVATAVTSL